MSEFGETLASLRKVRGISPFFVLDVGRPDDSWHPGTALLEGPLLAETIETIARRYRTNEPRVAASLFFLSYTARLLCPVTATNALDGITPDIRPGNLWWRYDGSGLSLRIDTPQQGPEPAEALAPIIDAIRKIVPVARGLLWGNAVSAIAGALRTMAVTNTISAEEATKRGEHVLEQAPWNGTGEFIAFPGEVAFRRRSCCLYYRLEGGGTCGDCPLTK
ncbi:hypothetical protein Lesp02_37740 [Lentzea sp. NBRC 105346]|uniref:(2Fe-2S)-binding protein n=1 Tax=Lentzea sp. NBRC 105346 TaxID=3032205 RepID=UPI0024A2CDB5|nr:(2Fe-2S)-binding protein [Lentzea sp. NBRC 105346]GLZ31586.1 hypothetical protein Lesp02_37740 [Lentzea sp. NBRC 105346]